MKPFCFPDFLSTQDQLFNELSPLAEAERQSRLDAIAQANPNLAAQLSEMFELERRAEKSGFLVAAPSGDNQGQTIAELQEISSNAPHEFQIGSRLGNFEILKFLASGGMGHIYEAQRIAPVKQTVAIKVLKERLDAGAKHRFRSESTILAGLSHPNILPLLDAGITEDNVPFIVMPLVRGSRIDQYIQQRNLPYSRQIQLMLQVCEAVQHAHDRGYLHRDLKPSNILVNSDAQVFVTDFGLGKILEPNGEDLSHSFCGDTTVGGIIGTPKFLPPEQLSETGKQITVRADVYGIGATLYAILTGQGPHEAETLTDCLLRAKTCLPTPVRQIAPTAPRDLDTICQKCLEIDPQRRYRSVNELADELQRYVEGRPILARRISPLERSFRWAKRNRLSAALLGLSLSLTLFTALGLAFALNTSYSSHRAEARERERSRALANHFLDSVGDALYVTPDGSEQRLALQKRISDILREFVAEAPTDNKSKRDYAVAQFKLGITELQLGNNFDGWAAIREAQKVFAALVENEPDDIQILFDLAQSHLQVGDAFPALEALRLLVTMPGANKFHKDALADTCSHIAQQLAVQQHFDAALKIAKEGETLARELQHEVDHRDTEQPVDFLKPLGRNLQSKAIVLYESGQVEKAFDCLAEAIEISDQLLKRNTERPEFLTYSIEWRLTTAAFRMRSNQLSIAEELTIKALQHAEEYARLRPDWRVTFNFLFWTQALLAEIRFEQRSNLAAAMEQEAISTLDELALKFDGWPDQMNYAFYRCCGRIHIENPEQEMERIQKILESIHDDSMQPFADAIIAWTKQDQESLQRSLKLASAIDGANLGRCLTPILEVAAYQYEGNRGQAEEKAREAENKLAIPFLPPRYSFHHRLYRFLDQVSQETLD